jgi:oligoribonuclease
MERKQDAGNLVWIDLEMTGLDASRDVILQAALIITDSELSVLEEFTCDIWQPESYLELMVPFVRAMHDRNGLLQRVRHSTVDLVAAERKLLERITGWCPYQAVLCGNTIGQDRRFIDRWMPALSGYLHYRQVDVTTLKVLAGRWYGEQAIYKKPEAGAHDALVDIKNSIAELAHYRANLLRPPA